MTWKDEFYVRAYELARDRLSDNDIALALGVRPSSFRRWLVKKPALADAVKRGRSNEKQTMIASTNDQFRLLKNPRQRRFLTAYAEVGNLNAAEEASGVSRHSHYTWMKWKPDEEYIEAFRKADEIATAGLESEAYRRARYGTRKMKFHQGMPVMVPTHEDDPDATPIKVETDDGETITKYIKPYTEHEYSDTLTIFLLKARRPDVYRDKPMQVNATAVAEGGDGGAGGDATNLALSALSIAELVAMAENGTTVDGTFVDVEATKLIEQHKENDDE